MTCVPLVMLDHRIALISFLGYITYVKNIGKGLDPVIIGDYHDHEEEKEVVVSEVIFLHLH